MLINNTRQGNKEVNMHGTYMLPYEIYWTSIPRQYISFPMHWHEEMELVYVMNGSAVYVVDFEEYIISKGDILFIPPSSLHSFRQYENEEFEAVTAIFSINMVNNNNMDICAIKYILPLFNNDIYLNTVIRAGSTEADEISLLVKKAARAHMEHKPAYELKVRIAFLSIIEYCFSNGLYTREKKSNEVSRITSQIKAVTNYIEEHYMEKITLDCLAEYANLSVYHMSHIFKKCTGQSPNEYINNYRLTIAANRLVSDDIPILNIAIDCGYNNISYFNRAFKNKYGITPGEYRKNHINE